MTEPGHVRGTSIRAAFVGRVSGAAGVVGLFALQSVYEAFLCGGGIAGFWSVTVVLAIPACFVLAAAGSRATLAMCATLVPFIFWANAAECAAYRGGGAAMAYVTVFLFGIPSALLVALAVAVATRRKDDNNEG